MNPYRVRLLLAIPVAMVLLVVLLPVVMIDAAGKIIAFAWRSFWEEWHEAE